ncbi:MAG: helix-turn-helix domain-containing protein [Saprospiraceae bacterium]|nr:helix-turn-helix domain-containing protein [Saprospiraceae bacterium]
MLNPFDSIEERLANIEALLVKLSQTNENIESQTEKDELLTVQDAANFLNLRVPTIYGHISKGELPVMKRSKRCYFSKLELINYLKEGRKKTNLEIEAIAQKRIAKTR